jgi:hypothetical protein
VDHVGDVVYLKVVALGRVFIAEYPDYLVVVVDL